jgi:hypothetical protein
LGLLFADLVVDVLDERRGQGFQWRYLVRQAQAHRPPVAGGGQCGDGLKLRWQRALNRMEGRQDSGISLEDERREAEGAHCATGVLQDRGAKRSGFYHESTGVLGVGELFQPIVKRRQTGMNA